MRPLRIAFLTDYLATLAGTESSIVTMIEMLRQSGDEVKVFCYSREGPIHAYWKKLLDDCGVPIVEEPSVDYGGPTPEVFCRRLAELLRSWDPHLIHAIPMGSIGLEWAMLKLLPNIPTVGTETSDASPRCFWYDQESFKYFNQHQAIIAPCETVRDGIKSFFRYEGEVEVIPHLVAVPAKEMKPITRAELANAYSLGSISRLRVEKGPEFMVAALAMMASMNPRISLTIYGELQEMERTSNLSRALGVEDRLSLHGPFRGRSEIGRIVRRHCIFLLPSLFESLPIALIEMIARGRVIVASRVGGIPELLDSLPGGILVPPGNSQAMAEAVLGLLEKPSELVERGKPGIQRYRERYDVDRTFAHLRDFYIKVARSRRRT
jgi:glycosyltransferase involved in cell wall biosynthesis